MAQSEEDIKIQPDETQKCKHGILVPVGDSRSLSKAMGEIIANELMRNAYRETAKAKAVEYSSDSVIDEFVDVLTLYLPST